MENNDSTASACGEEEEYTMILSFFFKVRVIKLALEQLLHDSLDRSLRDILHSSFVYLVCRGID